MKKHNVILYAIGFVLLSIFSCQKSEEILEINAEDYYGDGSYFISLARLAAPNIAESYCSVPQVYELRNGSDLEGIGTVTIYHNGRDLTLQYDLLPSTVNEGWNIAMSLVWIGLPEDWQYGKEGPDGGWVAVPGINVARYESKPISAIHQLPLDDWMFNDCIILAVRLALDDRELNRNAPKAFINNGDYLTYLWNEPFCLDKCDDPGTKLSDYWRNNIETWPFGLTIGNLYYSKELATQIMQESSGFPNDMTYKMFEQLAAAKLNVAIGNTSYCVVEIIEAADQWMGNYGPVGSGVSSTSPAWSVGAPLANSLTNYNTGNLCASSGK